MFNHKSQHHYELSTTQFAVKTAEHIVDADDKNCLAELTVAQKLNQGVRQWLYIIAGVLFFGTFFCTSKRKYIKTN